MKIKIFLLLLLSTVPAFTFAQKTDYKGYKHKGVIFGETLPNGVKDLGGGLLANEDYGVSRFSKGKKYMLWFEKIYTRDAKGVPNWEVLDVLNFDTLKRNQTFLISYSSACRQNGKTNLDLIVMAELLPEKKSYKIMRAWTANVRKAKFEKVSAKNITCKYTEK